MIVNTFRAAACRNCVIVGFNDDWSGVGRGAPVPLGLLTPSERLVDVEPESHFSWRDCETCGADAGDRSTVTVFSECADCTATLYCPTHRVLSNV